jgi:hypothetical protein
MERVIGGAGVATGYPSSWGKGIVSAFMIVHCQANLLEIILALHASGSLTHLLHGGQ